MKFNTKTRKLFIIRNKSCHMKRNESIQVKTRSQCSSNILIFTIFICSIMILLSTCVSISQVYVNLINNMNPSTYYFKRFKRTSTNETFYLLVTVIRTQGKGKGDVKINDVLTRIKKKVVYHTSNYLQVPLTSVHIILQLSLQETRD